MVNILTAGATRCLLGPKGGGFFEGGDAVGLLSPTPSTSRDGHSIWVE